MLFHAPIQGCARQSEFVGGARNIETMFAQRFENRFLLEMVEIKNRRHYRRRDVRLSLCVVKLEVAWFDYVSFSENDRPLYCMAQSSYIAGPLIIKEGAFRRTRKSPFPAAIPARKLRKKVIGDRQDIVFTIAQRWYDDLDGVEPEQQVGPESVRIPQFIGRDVGGRNDTDVEWLRRV